MSDVFRPRLDRRTRVAAVVTVLAVAGITIGLLVGRGGGNTASLSGGDGGTPAANAPAPAEPLTDFWDLGAYGSEGWVPGSLDELAQAAELVVVGHIVDVVDGGPYVSLEGADTGFRQIYLDVRVEDVVGAPTAGFARQTVRIDMGGALPDVSLDSLRSAAPQSRILFYLYDVFVEASRIAEARGIPLSAADRYRSTYAPLGGRGIVMEERGHLVTPLLKGGETTFRGVATLGELASTSRRTRTDCDSAKACLRDVLNPNGSFRGALSDPYPPRGKGGAVPPS